MIVQWREPRILLPHASPKLGVCELPVPEMVVVGGAATRARDGSNHQANTLDNRSFPAS